MKYRQEKKWVSRIIGNGWGRYFPWTTIFLIMIAGCGVSDEVFVPDNSLARASEANFYEIEPVSFSVQKDNVRLGLTSAQVRIFYSYHPADDGLEGKPLFVFFNGGPGCSTMVNLFSMNTAPYTLDRSRTDGELYAENPFSWTQIGNLLYIDAPNTGFSYNVSSTAWDPLTRLSAFGAKNYNPYIDAAQMVRVVLRFLEDHPAIETSEVIFVGESYAGIRVSAMLNMLLFSSGYADGSRLYQDADLVEEIQTHCRKLLDDDSEETITSEVVAKQFGHQILIQPQISGLLQDEITGELYSEENSIIDEVLGYDYPRWSGCLLGETGNAQWYIKQADHDIYNYSKPAGWTDEGEAYAMEGLLDVNVLSTVTGVDISDIVWLRPEARDSYAYRYFYDRDDLELMAAWMSSSDFSSLVQARLTCRADSLSAIETYLDANGVRSRSTSLENVFGELRSYDDYLSPTNIRVAFASMYNWSTILDYNISPDSATIYGRLFLQNLTLVKTFITDAALDLVIYSPALPKMFEEYTAIVESVEASRGTADDPDGSITIKYVDAPFEDEEIETPESATIYWPLYAESGHSVSSAQPEKLLSDVTAWLEQ
jgi:hypothetical protein